MSSRIPLVLFSGGADSAALLQMRLEHGPCDILVLDANVHPLKATAEELARDKIIRYLHEKNPVGRVRETIDLRKHFKPVFNTAWPGAQPPIWLMGALSAVDPDRHSMVEVGYVMGDDIQGNLDAMLRFWDAAIRAFFCQHWDTERQMLVPLDLPLSFPFRFTRKHGTNGIYSRLGSELLHMTWSCEIPEAPDGVITACGRCVPCRARATAMETMGWPYDQSKPPVDTNPLPNLSPKKVAKKVSTKRALPASPPRMKGAKKASKKAHKKPK